MRTLTIRLPDDTAQRLKVLAKSRGLSTNKLVEQLSARSRSNGQSGLKRVERGVSF